VKFVKVKAEDWRDAKNQVEDSIVNETIEFHDDDYDTQLDITQINEPYTYYCKDHTHE
jgi:hypothetical protein